MKTSNYNINANAGNWITSFRASGAMIITMVKNVSVYVQNGIANIYQNSDFQFETDVAYMNCDEFNDWLHTLENSYTNQ
jgi:hypothetical protein